MGKKERDSTSKNSALPPSSAFTGHNNVFLFVPNLIGYSRVFLAFLSFYLLTSHPAWAMLTYATSCLLDAFDGHAARYFNQSTKFGAVLDMVTDRSTTACLLVHLTTLHPQFALLYQFLISLDLSSHYFQMVSSLTVGNESHKQMEAKAHPLLRLYYMNKTVLFLVCALDQLFYITVYLLSWVSPETGELFLDGNGRTALWGLAVISGVFFVIKQVLNGIQLVGAAQVLARVDLQARLKGKEKVM